MTTDILSTDAARLWSVLKEHQADTPSRAMTDQALSEQTRLPRRAIIDAAGELLGTGVLVLAGPFGRWLGTPRQARHYARVLKFRAIRIFQRRAALVRALASARRQHSPDDTGQLALFAMEGCP